MLAATNILSNWVPQPTLHNQILGVLGQFAFADGTFKSRYCADQLLSKFADPAKDSSELRKSAAFNKLRTTELRNHTTNVRLSSTLLYSGEMHMARMIIQDVLGEFDIEDLYLNCDFSNGASQSRLKKEANKFSKFNGCSHVTNEALPYLTTLYKSCPNLRSIMVMQSLFNETKVSYSNTLFTVLKSDDIDRVCAKEPDWNMYFQKGLGKMIRSRLKKVNIDLNDQSINRELARVGSITDKLATLDLSSASDSVTSELVYQLLPRDWFEHLDRLRCPLGTFPDGTLHKWNLFSTMGNGFTFELESLIFYALARAACYTNGVRGRVSVYGDDIIVPSPVAQPLIGLLEYCGFLINEKKSFIEGPFRESCGGHYYNGQDVTPFYIKSPILSVQDLVLVLNKLRKWASQDVLDPRDGSPLACDTRLTECFSWLVSHIPNYEYIYGGPIELSGRYISGPGTAPFHLKISGKRKRPRQSEAYAYWLVHRDTRPEPLLFSVADFVKRRNELEAPDFMSRSGHLNTELSVEGAVKLRRNLEHSADSAPLFENEERLTIEV